MLSEFKQIKRSSISLTFCLFFLFGILFKEVKNDLARVKRGFGSGTNYAAKLAGLAAINTIKQNQGISLWSSQSAVAAAVGRDYQNQLATTSQFVNQFTVPVTKGQTENALNGVRQQQKGSNIRGAQADGQKGSNIKGAQAAGQKGSNINNNNNNIKGTQAPGQIVVVVQQQQRGRYRQPQQNNNNNQYGQGNRRPQSNRGKGKSKSPGRIIYHTRNGFRPIFNKIRYR